MYSIFTRNRRPLLLASLSATMFINGGLYLLAKDRVIIADSNDAIELKQDTTTNNSTDISATINRGKKNNGNDNKNEKEVNNKVNIPNLELKIKDPTGNVGSFNGILDNQIGTLSVPQPSN